MPRTRSPEYTHLLLELRGCPPARLNDRAAISRLLHKAAESCGLHVLHRRVHAFAPHGLTGYVLLQESHISVHTWPEMQFALVDVLSCAPLNRTRLVTCVQRELGATRVSARPAGRRRIAARKTAPTSNDVRTRAKSAHRRR